jgi:hypothetical protein
VIWTDFRRRVESTGRRGGRGHPSCVEGGATGRSERETERERERERERQTAAAQGKVLCEQK